MLTLFPEMFPGPLAESITGRALAQDIWRLEAVNIRDYARDKHRSVDDTPAGGGAGMVMRADILGEAIDAHWRQKDGTELIYLSPRGEPFTQSVAHELAKAPGMVMLCGRFEGIDERVLEARPIREISIGDYVLSGGELGAMVMCDAIVRLLPGVVGDEASLAEESFEQGLLEYPHYTRPQEWEGRYIPEVLMSGHHGKIADWRKAKMEEITQARRPDLWKQYVTRKAAQKE